MTKPSGSRKALPTGPTEVTALELKQTLGQLLSRVGFAKERITITRHGKPIAALVSAQDLETLDGAA